MSTKLKYPYRIYFFKRKRFASKQILLAWWVAYIIAMWKGSRKLKKWIKIECTLHLHQDRQKWAIVVDHSSKFKDSYLLVNKLVNLWVHLWVGHRKWSNALGITGEISNFRKKDEEMGSAKWNLKFQYFKKTSIYLLVFQYVN